MSDFLLNLARRAAGLAPVVGLPPAPPAPLEPGGESADPTVTAPQPVATVPGSLSELRPTVVVNAVAGESPVSTSVPSLASPAIAQRTLADAAAPLPLTTPALGSAERVMRPADPLPVPAAARTHLVLESTPVSSRAPSAAPDVVPPHTHDFERTGDAPSPDAQPVLPASSPRPSPDARESRVIERAAPPMAAIAVVPATPLTAEPQVIATDAVTQSATAAVLPVPTPVAELGSVAPTPKPASSELQPPPPAVLSTSGLRHQIETRERVLHTIERRVEPASALVRVERTQVATPAPPVPRRLKAAVQHDDPGERIVQVTIGEIEISTTGGDRPALPEVRSTPAPPSTALGFDDFTSLRSYAPWPR